MPESTKSTFTLKSRCEELPGDPVAKTSHLQDFPSGSVVKNPPASAGHRVRAWSRKTPPAAEQLSPCTPATEPVLQSP